MQNLEEQVKTSFEAALYFGRQLGEDIQFSEWKEEQELNFSQPPKELLDEIVSKWSERVELLQIKRKLKNNINTKQYLQAQQEYFVGAMVVLQQFYPEASFNAWMLLIESNRDILDFFKK